MNLTGMCYIWGPARGGSHVAHLNFKTSRVGVYKCLLLLVGFAVTVTIWLREVVSCRNFILRSVATFKAMSHDGISPGRTSYIIVWILVHSMNTWPVTAHNLRLCSFLLFSFSFTCIVVVYIICGILINIYIRHIAGKEAFPNYLFWVDFPFLVKVWVHK